MVVVPFVEEMDDVGLVAVDEFDVVVLAFQFEEQQMLEFVVVAVVVELVAAVEFEDEELVVAVEFVDEELIGVVVVDAACVDVVGDSIFEVILLGKKRLILV